MNVLIADDQTLFRDMMRSLLEQESDLVLVGCVENGAEALACCKARPVDLVLMDIRMPEMDGLTAAQKLQEQSPETRILLLTAFKDKNLTRLSGLRNIRGVLLKDIYAADLIQAIRLCGRDLYISDRSCLQALAASTETESEKEPAESEREPADTPFTPVDLKILNCLTQGMSNREIAENINYSEGTVKSHISRLLSEIGLKDRTQLALFALKHHLT